jgi:arginine decarboxylase
MALAQSETRISEPQTASLAAARSTQEVGLDISIRTGSGVGGTLLSAFDHALQRAGVADFNLVTLSSVIPTASRVRHVDSPLPGGHGDLLFCVRAEAFADQPGDVAWAGLGWVTDDTGGGLFVEHHGHSESAVIEQIEQSLTDMNANRGGGYGEIHTTLTSAECIDRPVCALVLAAYRVSSWHDGGAPAPGGRTPRWPTTGWPRRPRFGPPPRRGRSPTARPTARRTGSRTGSRGGSPRSSQGSLG